VRKLLLLTSSLDYSGPARRLRLLARALPRSEFAVRVCVLETETPWATELRKGGVEVEVFDWKRPLDVRPFLGLRRLLHAERPEAVHVFGVAALRAARLCGAGGARIVVSDLLRGGRSTGSWAVDRQLLGRVARVIAFGTAEAARYQERGIAAERITVVTPAVELDEADAAPADWPAGRVILGVGPIEAHKGFRDAVWAFDILQYLHEDLRLVLVGEGADRQRVEDFVKAVGGGDRIHFLGRQPRVEPYLRRAAVVWVPSLKSGGVCAALEALAAGRPVVAARVPELAEIIADGECGYLVPPGDKASLARQTRLLLDDPALAARQGEAGKRRVAEHFAAERMAADLARIYEQVGG
jgi:glycosyltransferase involved in cell wall biosynthesis